MDPTMAASASGPPFKHLDPGIRATVAFLVDAGFRTTDSGDGRSKPKVGRVFDFPHVVCRVTPDDILTEARRMRRILELVGITIRPCDGIHPGIEAAYDVGADVATIFLSGVDDALLSAHAAVRRED